MRSRSCSPRVAVAVALVMALGVMAFSAQPAAAATTVLINFDTPKDVTWKRRVKDPMTGVVTEVEFMKTTTPSGLDATQKALIMARMAGRYAGSGVTFTTDPAVAHTKTLDFTGGTTPAAIGKRLFGTTSVDHTQGWVFVGELAGMQSHGPNPQPLTPTEIAIVLSHTADHEVGHLMGLGHNCAQSLMTRGKLVSWNTRVTGFLLFSPSDSTKLQSLDDVDDHASAVQPGTQFGLEAIFDLAELSEEQALTDDLTMSAEVFAAGPADLSGFQYGTLNANGEFLVGGEIDNILLGTDADVFSMGSGEFFHFALRSPGGIVYSELDDNLISMQLSVPDGSVFQLANFFFDFDPNDADPSADANVILSAGLLDAGSGFLPAVAPIPVPFLPWTGRLALVLLLGGLVPIYVVKVFRTSNAYR